MFASTLLLAVALTAEVPPLPEHLGDFVRQNCEAITVAPADRDLYEEYKWKGAYRAEYSDPKGRRMTVDAFRFLDAEGADAAYLFSRPAGGVSPSIYEIPAVTRGGVTVMRFHNYVLRFRGAVPSISSSMAEMLAALPGLTLDSVPWEQQGRYLDESSRRVILGPVSLKRFAARIPASVAGFDLGAKGRVARFETPAGVMTQMIFEYRTEEAAKERSKVFGALPGAFVHVDRTCVGVILEPVDSAVAEELFDLNFGAPVDVGWDRTMWDAPMTLDEGLAMAFWGFFIGAVIAVVRRLAVHSDPFPNRMIFLRL